MQQSVTYYELLYRKPGSLIWTVYPRTFGDMKDVYRVSDELHSINRNLELKYRQIRETMDILKVGRL